MKNPLSSILNFFKNNKKPAQFSLDIDKLDNCILLAMLYISRNTTESGKYVYRSNTDVQTRYSDKQYSSLRHAGTLYSMYLCETLLGNTAIQNKRFVASEYFIKNYVKRVNSDMYGVVSKPFEEAPVLLATSGGTGLGLIALSNLLEENRIRKTILQKVIFGRVMNSEQRQDQSCMLQDTILEKPVWGYCIFMILTKMKNGLMLLKKVFYGLQN